MVKAPIPIVRPALLSLACLFIVACGTLQFFVANVTTRPGALDEHLNLAYGDGDRRTLDIYAAPGSSERPVVIFWYGGSWEMGRKQDYRFVGVTLARQGFVAVVPDYPLFPTARFPQFEDDGAQAIAWVESHISTYGGNPRKIVLMGHSAGAHTAAFLAYNHAWLRARGVDPSVIRGFVGLSGPYELVPDTDDLRRAFSAPYTAADWQPIRFVDAEAPPSLLLHGLSDREVLPKETIELSQALKQQHVQVEMHLYPHRRHGATVAPFSSILHWRTPAVEDTVNFIDRVTSDSR